MDPCSALRSTAQPSPQTTQLERGVVHSVVDAPGDCCCAAAVIPAMMRQPSRCCLLANTAGLHVIWMPVVILHGPLHDLKCCCLLRRVAAYRTCAGWSALDQAHGLPHCTMTAKRCTFAERQYECCVPCRCSTLCYAVLCSMWRPVLCCASGGRGGATHLRLTAVKSTRRPSSISSRCSSLARAADVMLYHCPPASTAARQSGSMLGTLPQRASRHGRINRNGRVWAGA
jgi:hypothetical protein